MAIERNGKIYRNLQEQVLKNKEDIEALQAVTPGIPDIPTGGVTEARVNELIAANAVARSNGEANQLTVNGLSVNNSLNMNYAKISSVGDPSNDLDAANKRYVDTAVANAGGGGSVTPSLPTLNGYTESIYCAAGNYNGGDVQTDHDYLSWDWSASNTGDFVEVGNFIFVKIQNNNPPPVEAVQIASFESVTKYALLWGMVGQTVTVYTNNVTQNGIFAVPHAELNEQMLLCFSKVAG